LSRLQLEMGLGEVELVWATRLASLESTLVMLHVLVCDASNLALQSDFNSL